jgi:hypothetical protein
MNTATLERQKLTDLADPRATKTAPREAFELASPFQFAAAEGEPSDVSVPVEFLARTGGPIDHWYWGRIVHDFAGMSHRDIIPIDYRHDPDELVGYLDKFDVREGDLYLGGALESVSTDDRAAEVIARGRRKIPYQASIYFNQETAVFEWLPSDMVANVNGRDVSGPLVIVREWELRGCAVTPYGCDAGTAAKFSADPAGAANLKWKGPVMDNTTTTETTNEDPSKLEATKTAASMDAARAELKSYIDKFGAEGAHYFSEGLNFEAAQNKHIEKLSADLTAERTRAEQAEQKLAAAQLSLGEREPIDTGSAATQKQAGFSSLFKPAGAK